MRQFQILLFFLAIAGGVYSQEHVGGKLYTINVMGLKVENLTNFSYSHEFIDQIIRNGHEDKFYEENIELANMAALGYLADSITKFRIKNIAYILVTADFVNVVYKNKEDAGLSRTG